MGCPDWRTTTLLRWAKMGSPQASRFHLTAAELPVALGTKRCEYGTLRQVRNFFIHEDMVVRLRVLRTPLMVERLLLVLATRRFGYGMQKLVPRCRTSRGHTSPVHHLAFSVDGKRLASRSHDGEIKWWHIQTGSVRENAARKPRHSTGREQTDFAKLATSDLRWLYTHRKLCQRKLHGFISV